MKTQHIKPLIIILILALASGACLNLTPTPTFFIPTVLVPTAASQASPTLAPPTVAPSSTPAPTDTPPPPTETPVAISGAAFRIAFVAWATSANYSAPLQAGATYQYVINVGAGYLLMVMLNSPNNGAVLGIYGISDGKTYVSPTNQMTTWQGRSAITQDYLITINATGGATSYSLGVTIPAPIVFQPGAISASVPGKIVAHQINSYIARASGGQTMNATITSPGANVLLTIYGLQDGQPLVRAVSGATTWTGTLPSSQDYIIQAVSVGDVNTSFTLKLIIQ